MKTVSIISTTYDKEKADNLGYCLKAIFSQNRMPDKVVLVADGTLTLELYKVVDHYLFNYPDIFVFKETENKGNWHASNTAISLCDTDIIAKIDSDDLLLPDYTQKILEVFENDEADICGVYIEEFDTETGEAKAVKKTPVTDEEIREFAKTRNPFNNPGIAFSKSFADKIGGYNEMTRCEDYDFVVRLLMAGARGRNIPQVLVRYRTSDENMKRRKNWVNTKWFIISRWRIHKMGFSSLKDFLIPSLAQLLLFILPVGLTKVFYSRLRK